MQELLKSYRPSHIALQIDRPPDIIMPTSTVEMRDALASKVEELPQALDQIKTLRGIVPICASCKKIRDDQGY